MSKLETNNPLYARVNSELDLLKENIDSKNTDDLAERKALKEQLDKWKKEKEEAKFKEKEERKQREIQAQVMLRHKLEEEKRAKKE